MNMEMKKSVMVVATQSMKEEGMKLTKKRSELVEQCNFLRLNKKMQSVISDSDSFPNYYYGDLNKETKEDLIKINTLYFIGIETLAKSNRELEKLIARNTNKESKGDKYFRTLGEGMSGIEEKPEFKEPGTKKTETILCETCEKPCAYVGIDCKWFSAGQFECPGTCKTCPHSTDCEYIGNSMPEYPTWNSEQTPETEIELSDEVQEDWQKSTLEIEDVEDNAIMVSEADTNPVIETFFEDIMAAIKRISFSGNSLDQRAALSGAIDVLKHELEIRESHEVFYVDIRDADTVDTPEAILINDKTYLVSECHDIEKDCVKCGSPFKITLAPDVTVKQAEELEAGIKICRECSSNRTLGIVICEMCGEKAPAELCETAITPDLYICVMCLDYDTL
jgi:hypothetical protein